MELVSSCVFWLKICPRKSGVSNKMSPRTIIKEIMIYYNKHCKLNFGQYVPTHESHVRSTGTAHTIGALALRPTGNKQEGCYFYSLGTFRTINLNLCTPLPMPDDVISHIHDLARNDPTGITFTDRNENKIEEDDEDCDYDYVPYDEEDIEDDGYYHPDDGSTRNSGDDYLSDDDGPDPHFRSIPNVDDKSTGIHDTTEEEDPTDNTGVGIKNETQNNTGVEIRNETQNNSKDEDEDEDPQDEVGDSK